MPRVLLIALMALASLAAPAVIGGQAWAQKRVALVIGNSAYKHTGELPNPRNDAVDMAAALARHGFQVIEGLDLNKTAFDRKVRDFAVALEGASAGVFFYAGHGISVGGHNYLVPIDAELTTSVALEFEMVRTEVVHRVMERQTTTNILFLDACRDNPLSRNLARSMGTRSMEIGKGLAAVEGGVGTLISFSTQPGNVASDGTGRNSPFAGALVKQLSTSNEDLGAILIAVRNDVMKDTDRRQIPWEHSALTGRFFFTPQVANKPMVQEKSAADAWLALNDGPASELFSQDDLKSIAAVATKKLMPLPTFQMRKPPDNVPAKIRRFVGVWISNVGWGGSGRQYSLIITNVDEDGRAVGHTVRGPPTPTTWVPTPAGHSQFSGQISGDRLAIRFGKSTMWAVLNSTGDLDVVEQLDDGRRSSIALARAWSLVETERAARR
jgi:Caspase domain